MMGLQFDKRNDVKYSKVVVSAYDFVFYHNFEARISRTQLHCYGNKG
jgi:hypothetical protein